MKNHSFVIDTNVWISAIITKSESTLINYILQNELKIFICPEMIDEIEDVLSRKKLKKYLNFDLPTYLDKIKTACDFIQIELHYNQAPDIDDNYLYDICIATNSVLVTGDKILLRYISNPPITTISRNNFFEIY